MLRRLAISAVWCICILAAPSIAEDWQIIEWPHYSLAIEVPGSWSATSNTEQTVPYIEASNAQGTMSVLVRVYRGTGDSPEALIGRLAQELGMTVMTDEKRRRLNGLPAFVASGTGEREGVEVFAKIAVVTRRTDSVVACVHTPKAKADGNSGTIDRIIQSLAVR